MCDSNWFSIFSKFKEWKKPLKFVKHKLTQSLMEMVCLFPIVFIPRLLSLASTNINRHTKTYFRKPFSVHFSASVTRPPVHQFSLVQFQTEAFSLDSGRSVPSQTTACPLGWPAWHCRTVAGLSNWRCLATRRACFPSDTVPSSHFTEMDCIVQGRWHFYFDPEMDFVRHTIGVLRAYSAAWL